MKESTSERFLGQDELPRDSRIYVHRICGKQTGVTKGDFRGLVDPYQSSDRTYCVWCQKMDALDQYVWLDTGETIAAFRQRMKSLTPMSLILFRWIAPWVTIFLGAGIAMRFTSVSVGVIAGGLAGALLAVILTRPLSRMLWGIDYRRMT